MPYYHRRRYPRRRYYRNYRRRENNVSGVLSSAATRAASIAADRLVSESTLEKILPWIQSGLAAIPPIAGIPIGQAASAATGLLHSGYHWFFDDDSEGDSSERGRDTGYSELDQFIPDDYDDFYRDE